MFMLSWFSSLNLKFYTTWDEENEIKHQSTTHGHDLKYICNAHKQAKELQKFKEPILVRQNIDKDNFFINLLT
jgi:hypothetical protein